MNWKGFKRLEDVGLVVYANVDMNIVRSLERKMFADKDVESIACWVQACYTLIGDLYKNPTATAAMWGYYDSVGLKVSERILIEEPFYYLDRNWHRSVIVQILTDSVEYSNAHAEEQIKRHFQNMRWDYAIAKKTSRLKPEETIIAMWEEIGGAFGGCKSRLIPRHPAPPESEWLDSCGNVWRVDSMSGVYVVLTRLNDMGELECKKMRISTLTKNYKSR